MSLWRKLPPWLRAILLGLLILAIGLPPWSLLAKAQLESGAKWPWAAALGLLYLVILWRYLGGSGWPASTADSRRRYLRGGPVIQPLLGWALLAGGLLAAALIAFQVLGWVLGGVSAADLAEFRLLGNLPFWTGAALLLTGAAFAGVVEEAAFRGYIQVPLEDLYRPGKAIAIVAAFFALAHFPSLIGLPFFFLGGLGWGYLAYYSGSIWPGVLIHTLTDGLVWIWILGNVDWLERTFGAAAAGQPFLVLPLFIAAASGTLFTLAALWAFRRLATLRQL